jgi:hypothetical protein
MRSKMAGVIDAYIQTSNSRDADRFGSLFSEDAIVHDEGQEYRGVVAIRKWLASRVKRYAFTLTPIDSRWRNRNSPQREDGRRLSWQSIIGAFSLHSS